MAQYTVRRRDGVDCIYLADYAVVVAEFAENTRNATKEIGRLLDAAPKLLEALDLIGRIANLESGEVSQNEWDEYIAPFARHNYASMMAILDAIQAIARTASEAMRTDVYNSEYYREEYEDPGERIPGWEG